MSIQNIPQRNIAESNTRIIEHLASGKVYKEIAAEMGMPRWTVIDRVRSMKKNHSCKTVAELVTKVNTQPIVPNINETV